MYWMNDHELGKFYECLGRCFDIILCTELGGINWIKKQFYKRRLAAYCIFKISATVKLHIRYGIFNVRREYLCWFKLLSRKNFVSPIETINKTAKNPKMRLEISFSLLNLKKTAVFSVTISISKIRWIRYWIHIDTFCLGNEMSSGRHMKCQISHFL